VAIGSRSHSGQTKSRSRRASIGGSSVASFAFFVNLLAIEGIGDTQCGFKMFHREAAAAIFSRQECAGFAFDVEILFIARRLSLLIAEIPSNWVAQPGSKVNLITDSIRNAVGHSVASDGCTAISRPALRQGSHEVGPKIGEESGLQVGILVICSVASVLAMSLGR